MMLEGGSQRHHDTTSIETGVFGKIFKNALHGHWHLFVIDHRLPDGILIGKHAAGQLPADEDHLRIIQLARVSTDNINAHSGKETRIGRHGIGLETAFIGKPSRIAPPLLGDGNTLHLVRQVFGNGTSHRSKSYMRRMILVVVIPYCFDKTQTFMVLVAGIIIELECLTGKNEDTDCQPQSQGNNLDEVGAFSSYQCLKSVI